MQPTKKISQLPPTTSPTLTDKVPLVSGGTTDYALISDLITLFNNNIPAGAHSDVTRWAESGFDYVASGGVWTADSAGVNRNASMTAMIIYINGRRLSISAVTARTFTASKDTNIDVLDNQDGTGTLVYTEVANNAASPALAANSVRIGIIVTGATTIAAAGSINQGQETKVLPIASSIPYQVNDSLGNLICPRDPNRKLLGYRQILVAFTSATAGSFADITGLDTFIMAPTNRKVKVSTDATYAGASAAGGNSFEVQLYDATAAAEIKNRTTTIPTAAYAVNPFTEVPVTPPASGSRQYKVRFKQNSAGTFTYQCAATQPAFLKIELE